MVSYKTILILLGIFSIYFLTRLINIMSLPIFTDEAIYVRWAQIARFDAAWRFISLTDGKQPSFIWLAMNFMRVFDDPLFASRIVSVFTGFIALVGVMLTSWEIFKEKLNGRILNQIFGHLKKPNKIGYIAGILFVLFPFALVYDRMALYDSTLTATMVWVMYLTILMVRYIRLDLGILYGFAAGSAILTKTSGFFSIYLLPFSFLLFDFRQKSKKIRLLQLGVFIIIGITIALIMYSMLRLSQFFYIIDEKNTIFVWTFSEWIKRDKIEIFLSNFKGLWSWFSIYLSFPVIALAISSFLIPEKRLEKLYLLSLFMIPFLALCIFGKTIYPRFIYFMTPPIIILASYSLLFLWEKVRVKFYFIAVFLVILLIYIRADYYIIFNFAKAPIPQSDLGQYINSWPAGGGIKEMIEFFEKEVKDKGRIYVATQGTFGSLPTYAMEIYLGQNKNIETSGIYPLPEIIPSDLKEKAKFMPVYLVLNDTEKPPDGWPVTLISKYQKGIGDRHLSIYRINP